MTNRRDNWMTTIMATTITSAMTAVITTAADRDLSVDSELMDYPNMGATSGNYIALNMRGTTE